MKRRYVVYGYGWQGYSGLEEVLKYGDYFNTLEEAKNEYERLWNEELNCEEGACIYDTVEKKFIIED